MEKENFVIDGYEIGDNHPPYVIAEIAQTHEGSLGSAMAFIDLARDCGANAVKFQTHIASEESTLKEPWRKPFSYQDETRYDYWKRMEFTFSQWQMLKSHADEVGITFLSSPFSIKACEWLSDLGMKTWKIASGEVHNKQLIDWIIKKNEPIIFSSGLSDIKESRNLVHQMFSCNSLFALLHCTTQYPTIASQVGLNIFQDFKREFPDVPIGISDHSGEIFPGVISAYLGANIVEVHLTMSDHMFGPDIRSSLNPKKFKELVRGVKFGWEAYKSPVNKAKQLSELRSDRNIFTRSLVAARDMDSGEIITYDMLGYKKPGGGLPFELITHFLGKRTMRKIKCDEQMDLGDVE